MGQELSHQPAGLATLHLQGRYRTGSCDLLQDFYIPCLSQTKQYDRAVGFFTTGSLLLAAQGIAELVERDGRVRLIASPRLSPEDVSAIMRGYAIRQEDPTDRMLQEVSVEKFSKFSSFAQAHLHMTTWMIANGYMEIRVALLTKPSTVGMYHEKIGLMTDEYANSVAFSGSSNESIMGIRHNYESFNVFRSWIPEDARRVVEHSSDFRDLWENRATGVETIPLPKAVHERLIELAPAEYPGRSFILDAAEPSSKIPSSDALPQRPSGLELRPYQVAAIEAWFDSHCKGIFGLATGAGKTVTAIAAITAAIKAHAHEGRPLLVVITAPYKVLVNQWNRELTNFGIKPILCQGDTRDWNMDFAEAISALKARATRYAVAVTTNRTFTGTHLQNLLGQVSSPLLLVADEVHNMGASLQLQCLPERAQLRLGLSATPERAYDDAGTNGILDYFGPVIAELSLSQALEMGFLTPYYYYPILVPLSEHEAEEYEEITTMIAKCMHSVDELEFADGPLSMLLFKRARLIGGAVNKLEALKKAIEPYAREFGSLVYCGEAEVDDQNGLEAPQRQLDAVVTLLGRDLGMNVHAYTSQEDETTRADIERRFRQRDLDALIAIRCLDEGVDLPDVRRAFILASSTNPRQFIQRRGRVLRRAPGKEKAEIFDFIVTPPDIDASQAVHEIDRKLVKRELLRVVEFAESAVNGIQAMASLLELRRRYRLIGLRSRNER